MFNFSFDILCSPFEESVVVREAGREVTYSSKCSWKTLI